MTILAAATGNRLDVACGVGTVRHALPDGAATVGGLAVAVQDARRELGLSRGDVAEVAALDEVDVASVEDGLPTAVDVVERLCRAVRLDPAPFLPGRPHGLLARVEPVDAVHAATVDMLSSVTVGDGWLALPDLAAREASGGPTLTVLAEALRLADGRTARSHITGPSLAIVPFGFFAADLVAGVRHIDVGPLMWLLVACTLLSLFSLPFVSPDLDARIAASRASRKSLARREAEGRRGHVFSAKGLSVLDVADGEVERTDYPVAAMSSVEVVDEDALHVTVRVRTALGDVEAPWVARSRDVLDAIARWDAEVGSRAPAGRGYKVPTTRTLALEGLQ